MHKIIYSIINTYILLVTEKSINRSHWQLEVGPCQGCSANKKVWERIQKIASLKQLQIHFKTKREKGVGTPFPRVPAPQHP